MTVLQEGKVVVIAVFTPPTQAIRLTASIGSTWPLHSSAEGKVLLAGLPLPSIRALLHEPLEARTSRTVTAPDALLAEIQEAAGSGFAVDQEGTAMGISALAARLIDAAGTRYALSILLPTSRFEARFGELREQLLGCRAAIAASAGLPA
ncbi:IclR family transcriptional regulator [Roseomonas nepalensis]|uniref:IclR family transcriptional regulator n=2 Tax=Muricoccus nepalensis TaxID=1854500 RepID=A0A502G9R4_9PROT|nr:IclR family transcriptional regulator [Roseomonas nepalensis]